MTKAKAKRARDVRKPALDPCPECGATEAEACPLDDHWKEANDSKRARASLGDFQTNFEKASLSPSLLTGSAIGAAKGGECNGDDGVCETCQ